MSDEHFTDEPDLERNFAGDPSTRALWAAAGALRHGNLSGAVLHLRRLLGSDPQHAEAHALLSRVLVAQQRHFAAEHEARAALAIEPELVSGHLALAEVHFAHKRLAAARAAWEHALQLDPSEVDAVRGLARIAHVEGRPADEHRELLRALELDPQATETLVELGRWHLQRGELAQADDYAQRARSEAPDEADVLVLLGHLALRHGRVDEARDLALWALGQGPMDPGALGLLASVRARQSLLLGLWWRYSVWMAARGEKRQIVILLAAWLAFRVAELVSRDLGVPTLATITEYVWLAVVVYSWVGPGLFMRTIEKELEAVQLRRDF